MNNFVLGLAIGLAIGVVTGIVLLISIAKSYNKETKGKKDADIG